MKPVNNQRARPRRRARRPLSESLVRSSALFMFLQGMILLVILAGLALITIGMTASLGDFFGEITARSAALREAEADIPVPLAAAALNENGQRLAPRQRITQPPPAEQAPAAEGTPAPDDTLGFLPYQVPVEQMNEQAPAIPVTGPEKHSIHIPSIMSAPPEPVLVTATPQPSPTPVPPGPPERIVIPILALDAPVTPTYTQFVELRGQVFEQWLAPDWYAAGWQQGSAQVGEMGNTVLNGHHNIHGSVFALLYELIQGDEIIVYSGDREYRYIVSQVMNLQERGVPIEQRQENARWVLPSTDQRLTLVTCWPPESNTHRIIVVAVPVP